MVSTGSGSESNQSYVFRGQEPYLLDLYGKGQALSEGQTQGAVDIASGVSDAYLPAFQNAVGKLFNKTGNVNRSLSDIAYGNSGLTDYSADAGQRTAKSMAQSPQGLDFGQRTLGRLQTGAGDFDMGLSTLGELQGSGINPYLEGLVGSASDVVTKNLQRNILPSINSGGNAVNPYGGGGSRQGIAEGLALSDANQQVANMATNIYGQAYDADQNRRLQAAQSYSQLGDVDLARQLEAAGMFSQLGDVDQQRQLQAANQFTQNKLASKNQAMQAQFGASDRIVANQSNLLQQLLTGAEGATSLAMSPLQQAWNQLLNYKQLVSNPVVLSQGSSKQSNLGIL